MIHRRNIVVRKGAILWFHYKHEISAVSLDVKESLENKARIRKGVSRENSKKCDITAKYSPQILTVHSMYTAKKLALQANIFKISNVEYNKSVRNIFFASNHFLHWFLK